MSRIFLKPAMYFLPLLFLLYPSCRSVVRRGVPGADYAVIRVQNGQSTGVETKRISAYQNPNPKPPFARPSPPMSKTNPVIDQWIKNPQMPDPQLEEILIGLLPPKDPKYPGSYLRDFEDELVKLGGQHIHRYDSIYTFSLTLPVGALRGPLPADRRIRYIEPNRVHLTRDMIPAQGASGSTCKGFDGYASPAPFVEKIHDIAVRTGLDPFANPPSAGIALLDSGVGTHTLLPEPQITRRDCLNPPCTAGGSDSCANHGTPDAGILIATGAGTQPHGLLQGAALHSFRVFEGSGSAGSCSDADARAAGVVEVLNVAIPGVSPSIDVILTEALLPGGANSSAAAAVDSAFDAGYPVIVAAIPTPTLLTPANAHRGFPVSASSQTKSTSSDGRLVPAVWADTNSETTSGSTSPLCKHDGASGAAPYAAAAAAKLRNLLRSNMQPDAPGNVYALLLALAKPVGKRRVLYLPPSGQFLTGSFDISQGGEAYAEVIVANGDQLRAAIWWPESPATDTGTEVHNEIHLDIGKPAGISVAKGIEPASVFQYAAYSLPTTAGTWMIKATGTNVVAGPQRVYWAAYAGH